MSLESHSTAQIHVRMGIVIRGAIPLQVQGIIEDHIIRLPTAITPVIIIPTTVATMEATTETTITEATTQAILTIVTVHTHT